MLQETGSCHKDLRSIEFGGRFTESDLHFGFAGNSAAHLVNLSNQLARVCEDHNLNLGDGDVNLHQAGHEEGTRLSRPINGLKGVIIAWVVQNVPQRNTLNNRWSIIRQSKQTHLDLLWNLKLVPILVLGLKILNDFLLIELAHALNHLWILLVNHGKGLFVKSKYVYKSQF